MYPAKVNKVEIILSSFKYLTNSITKNNKKEINICTRFLEIEVLNINFLLFYFESIKNNSAFLFTFFIFKKSIQKEVVSEVNAESALE